MKAWVATVLFLLPAAALSGQSVPYQVVEVQGGATLRGSVTFEGDALSPSRLLITKDIEVCGAGYRERSRIDLAEDAGLRGVVIALQDVRSGKPWPADLGHELDQVDCYFTPHVQVVPWGADLSIVNSDAVLHNIHSYEVVGESRRTLFNHGQPPERGTIVAAVRTRRSDQVRLECDAHDFMLGWIYVSRNPYAAVVDHGGSFSLDQVPPGVYQVIAWHPHLGILEQEVTLEPAGTSEITFEFIGSSDAQGGH